MVWGSNPGREEIFRTCTDRPWGPPSLLYNGYRVFLGGKERPGCDADHSSSSSAVVKKVQSLSACTRVHCTFTLQVKYFLMIMSTFIYIYIQYMNIKDSCVQRTVKGKHLENFVHLKYRGPQLEKVSYYTVWKPVLFFNIMYRGDVWSWCFAVDVGGFHS